MFVICMKLYGLCIGFLLLVYICLIATEDQAMEKKGLGCPVTHSTPPSFYASVFKPVFKFPSVFLSNFIGNTYLLEDMFIFLLISYIITRFASCLIITEIFDCINSSCLHKLCQLLELVIGTPRYS